MRALLKLGCHPRGVDLAGEVRPAPADGVVVELLNDGGVLGFPSFWGSGHFHNAGILRKTAGNTRETVFGGVVFHNSGIVEAAGGTLRFASACI